MPVDHTAGGPSYWPTAPSMRSRIRSAWPMCLAYSSTMWVSTQRSDSVPRHLSSRCPVISRLGAAATNCSANATSSRHARQASSTTAGSGLAPSQSPSRSSGEENRSGTSSPAMNHRNQPRSTSDMCRISPSSDILDGSTDRRASASASSPEHFSSRVLRYQSRKPVSMASSPASPGGSVLGSLSGSMNMSMDMPAIIRAARGVPQGDLRLGGGLLHARPDLVHVERLGLRDELLERRLGQRARLRVQHDVVADDHQCGDGRDVEGGRHRGLRLGVDLAEHRAGVLLRGLLEYRPEHPARTAPLGPEIDEDEAAAGHRRVEVLGRQLDRRHCRLLALNTTRAIVNDRPPNIPGSQEREDVEGAHVQFARSPPPPVLSGRTPG